MKALMQHKSIILILLCGMLFACGKESMPVPQDQKSLFNWKRATAHVTENNCIIVSVTMVGAVKNIRSFSLELEAISPSSVEDDLDTLNITTTTSCEDCPFKVRETSTIHPQQVIISEQNNKAKYFFRYCPKEKSTVYKWRLVISNIFANFPYIITPVSMTTQ